MSILTQDFVLAALDSKEEYPVDFDDVWQTVGYTRKDNAKRSLLSSGYVAGEDFWVFLKNEENPEGGRPEEKIYLTVDCFKAFCMLTRSEQGREVRKYFIEVERAYRQQLEAQFNAPAPDRKVAELEELLADWQVKYRHIYDRMQYFQARSIGGDMLKRLQEKPEEFSEDSEWLWQIAGVHCKYYFVGRCKEDLIYGVDYVLGNRKGQIKLTPHAALQMMLNLRSRKGVQVRYLPEKADIDVPKIVGKKPGKINRRQLQSQEE